MAAGVYSAHDHALRRLIVRRRSWRSCVPGRRRGRRDRPSRPGQPPAVDSIGIRLLEAPADAADDPRAQVHIVDHLAPGTTITRQIEVSNTSATHAPRDPLPGGGDHRRRIVHRRRRPHGQRTVHVDVGDSRSASTSRPAARPRPPSPSPSRRRRPRRAVRRGVGRGSVAPPRGAGITQVSRVGIRLYISVGPGGAPAADFSIESLPAERTADGTPRSWPPCATPAAGPSTSPGRSRWLTVPAASGPDPSPPCSEPLCAIDATDAVTIDSTRPPRRAVGRHHRPPQWSGRAARPGHHHLPANGRGLARHHATHGGGGRALAPLAVGLGLVATGVAGAGALRLRRRGRRRVLAPS